ncbi:DUF7139 domain-containing protein [Halovenus marina]|uniref:DUF7139 domain-containing protein n=1 Tax=Halovenus marina TaxID=3396621 RepID=UPI003F56AB39
MTSLSRVYEGGVGSVVDRKRRVLGMSVFVAGVAMVVGAIPLATTGLPSSLGLTTLEARELAGVLAGLGVPAVFVGIFAVLPASNATRAAGAIGASLAVLGVGLFQHAYPQRWLTTDPGFTLATIVVYSLGTLITFWCLFIAAATFKTRNKPGGTARLEITDEGTVRLVETESPMPGFGSVGLFGRDPDGDVETQTNRDDDDEMLVPEPTAQTPDATATASDQRTQSSSQTQRSSGTKKQRDTGPVTTSNSSTTTGSQSSDPLSTTPEPTSDGGTAVSIGSEQQTIPAARRRSRPDSYCGNCEHFEYVRADGEITPYCGLQNALMEDMDACEEWEPNN